MSEWLADVAARLLRACLRADDRRLLVCCCSDRGTSLLCYLYNYLSVELRGTGTTCT